VTVFKRQIDFGRRSSTSVPLTPEEGIGEEKIQKSWGMKK